MIRSRAQSRPEQTSNIEQSTLNIEVERTSLRFLAGEDRIVHQRHHHVCSMFDVDCSMFDVQSIPLYSVPVQQALQACCSGHNENCCSGDGKAGQSEYLSSLSVLAPARQPATPLLSLDRLCPYRRENPRTSGMPAQNANEFSSFAIDTTHGNFDKQIGLSGRLAQSTR